MLAATDLTPRSVLVLHLTDSHCWRTNWYKLCLFLESPPRESFLHKERAHHHHNGCSQQCQQHGSIAVKGVCSSGGFGVRIQEPADNGLKNGAAQKREEIDRAYRGTCNLNRKQ